MIIGASSACFYPLETEQSLRQIIELGFKKTEVFFNSFSELETPFVKSLKEMTDSAGVQICAVHPFSSFMETNCIFGDYQRRFEDVLEIYKRYCEISNIFGSNIIVIHGAMKHTKKPIPKERYFERFKTLVDMGKEYGVSFAQENVNAFFSQDIEFCKELRDYLGPDYKMVFDVKQAVRAGKNPFDFVDEFGENIIHIHLSDSTKEKDCVPPGKGNFDIKALADALGKKGYNGEYIIEIYSENYDVKKELQFSKNYMEGLF